jgi:hypothetical protein
MMENWNYNRSWYHGSPYRLKTLLSGSTITQDIDLARVFSHKPPVVSIEDDPQYLARFPRIRHNGVEKGLLYRIDESIGPEDVFLHPNSSMAPGFEWITRRPLRLSLIGLVAVRPEEFLSENDIQELMKRSS